MNVLNPDFVASIKDIKELEPLLTSITGTQPEVSVRWRRGEQPAEWSAEGECVAWWPTGRYLSDRRDFTRDVAMHQGRYYVQEASSMFVGHILRRLTAGSYAPVAMLDACAAPGGKTTVAVEALPEGSCVVANELSPQRAAVLVENVVKHGSGRVIATRGDATRFGRLDGAFDIVLCDAPCSGEGMMRKDATAREQWSAALVAECAGRQRAIVDALWHAVRPGGYLIYSTCTFNRHENEEIVDHLIGAHGAESVEIPIDPAWHITPGIETKAHCYRFIPGVTRGEGLFMAVLRRPTDDEATPKRNVKPPKSAKMPAELLGRFSNADDLELIQLKSQPDCVFAVYRSDMPILRKVESTGIEVIWAGVCAGEEAGRVYAPTQSLAMSRLLNRDAFPQAEVDTDTALEYLRRNAVTLGSDTPRGYVLLTYEGAPLGFVKNLGNRANNLYPHSWRIRSTY